MAAFVNGALQSNGSPVIVNAGGNLPALPPLSGLDLLDKFIPGNLPSPNDLVNGAGNAGTGALTTVTDTATAAASAGKAVVAAAEWMADRDNWIRIVKVVLGAVMMIEGMAMLASKALLTPQVMSALTKIK